MGWALLAGPLHPIDWAVVRSANNDHCLKAIRRVLDRYEPVAIVIEEFENGLPRRVERVQHLCQTIVRIADARAIECGIYSRADVCKALNCNGTRQEIADAVTAHLDIFQRWLPPKRKPWMAQDARLALLTAVALALTYFAVTDPTV